MHENKLSIARCWAGARRNKVLLRGVDFECGARSAGAKSLLGEIAFQYDIEIMLT